jgi:hypothetical protein
MEGRKKERRKRVKMKKGGQMEGERVVEKIVNLEICHICNS